jgi:hypothetical protein
MNTRTTMRRINREHELAALRDGRRTRSATFTDRKKKASKDACRNTNRKDW